MPIFWLPCSSPDTPRSHPGCGATGARPIRRCSTGFVRFGTFPRSCNLRCTIRLARGARAVNSRGLAARGTAAIPPGSMQPQYVHWCSNITIYITTRSLLITSSSPPHHDLTSSSPPSHHSSPPPPHQKYSSPKIYTTYPITAQQAQHHHTHNYVIKR